MGKLVVSDQDLVLAYKCNDVIDFSLSRGESIADIDVDHTVHVICTEYTSEPFEGIMADLVKFMNDYPMNKAKPVSVSDKDLELAYAVSEVLADCPTDCFVSTATYIVEHSLSKQCKKSSVPKGLI